MTLHSNDPGYFVRIKAQLDVVLSRYSVHYFFFAEAPGKGKEPVFEFLKDIFAENDRIQVSHMNTVDVETTLFHMMNADMLVTTGSSFPYIAATLSPKVRSTETFYGYVLCLFPSLILSHTLYINLKAGRGFWQTQGARLFERLVDRGFYPHGG